MRILLLAALAAFLLHAADDDWSKVKAIKSGLEVRIYKKGSPQPVLAKMDEANDENLIVVAKNEQIAIPKAQIDRVDYRPAGGRVTKETKASDTNPGMPDRSPDRSANIPGRSYSSNVNVGSKPDFETVYRRPAGAPKKAPEK